MGVFELGTTAAASSPLQADRGGLLSCGRGIWYVALGATLWGVDPLFRILLLQHFTSAQIVFLEHLLLAVYSVPVLIHYRHQLAGKLTLGIVGAMLFISWGGSAIATVMFTAAFSYGNFNAVLLLQKLQPLFAILLARIVLREALPRRFGWFLLLALAGTYLLTFGFGSPALGLHDLATLGCLLSIGAAALWGGSTVMGKYLLTKGMGFHFVTALRFLLAIPLLGLLVLVAGDGWQTLGAGGAAALLLVNLLFQAFIPGLLSMLLYYKGLSGTKASLATLAELAFPAVGVLINWLVFDQALTAGQVAGFVVIWTVLVLLSRSASRSAQPAAPAG
ncbi:Permease of the drug/metabolite transporter (DMT) superfamily [Paenibacillus pasadenensis]|uniref:Permease of the drug/metabolite transporter (DMT) superfamily n=1 Tax=Paenibacillus pasadenensis TaxID=217090 RepID=A0A2N5N6P7_9BACL|nr:Permease of the drug/metabolite transporter (DMT) superfamily [Paenibacillus pasadenensis]